MSRFIEITRPVSQVLKIRETLKHSFFENNQEYLKLEEKRIRASEECLKRVKKQYEKDDPEMMRKLKTNIDLKYSPYRYLFWPSLRTQKSIWTVIEEQTRDPECYFYFCENDEGKLIGCCGYYINKETGKPEDIHLFSWEKGLLLFDAFTMFNNLIREYGEIEWNCVKGNPAEKVYDEYIQNKELNGFIVEKIDEEIFNSLEKCFTYHVRKGEK